MASQFDESDFVDGDFVATQKSFGLPAFAAPTATAAPETSLDEMNRIKNRILEGSKLVREESGLELWDTPKGPFWIPKGNRFVLPFNLAEMELRIYGSGEHFIRPGDVVLDCGASDGDFTRVALAASIPAFSSGYRPMS